MPPEQDFLAPPKPPPNLNIPPANSTVSIAIIDTYAFPHPSSPFLNHKPPKPSASGARFSLPQANFLHNGIPLNGFFLSAAVIRLSGIIYFGSPAAFNSFTGATSICLSSFFGFPILISLLRGRKLVEHSMYSLGRFGYLTNIVSVAWVILAVFLFCMSVQLPVTLQNMNYTSVIFVGFASISVVWYLIRGRKSFSGPPVDGIFAVLEGVERDHCNTTILALGESLKTV